MSQVKGFIVVNILFHLPSAIPINDLTVDD